MKLSKITRIAEKAPALTLKQRFDETADATRSLYAKYQEKADSLSPEQRKTARNLLRDLDRKSDKGEDCSDTRAKLSAILESQVNEGPLDFLRGAGAEAGRRAGGAAAGVGRAVKQGVGNVVQAGAAASAQGNLEKAIANLAALLTKAGGNAAPQPQQQQAEPEQKPQGNPSDAVPDAFRRTSKPKGVAGKDGQDFQWTFSSYMQAIHGDQLDEGIWDFVKGAGKAVGAGVRDKINQYADRPSVFKDIYQKGLEASQQGDANKQAQAKQALQGQIKAATQQVQQLAAKVDPQVLMAAIRKMGGPQANAIAKLLAPQQQAAPAQAAPTGGTPAGPEVRQQQAAMAQRRAARQ